MITQGKQPWDFIVEVGWGPEYAAGRVLSHLRGGDEERARWYWARLDQLMLGELLPDIVKLHPKNGPRHAMARAAAVIVGLKGLLTEDELAALKKE